MGVGIEALHPLQDVYRNACGRMHRYIKGYEIGVYDVGLVKSPLREVLAIDGRPDLSQPGGRRGEAKGLPTQFIGGDQHDSHIVSFPLWCTKDGKVSHGCIDYTIGGSLS